MAATPDPLYTKLLEQAIILLAASVVAVGGALGGVLIYIYKKGQEGFSSALQSLENRIGEIATSLCDLSEKLFERTDVLKDKTANLESRFERREGICDERHNHGEYPYRRKHDTPRGAEDP